MSLELMVDPVTAVDGFLYERDAIEEFFEYLRHNSDILDGRSPKTNLPMKSTHLMDAVAIRNAICYIVNSGAFGTAIRSVTDKILLAVSLAGTSNYVGSLKSLRETFISDVEVGDGKQYPTVEERDQAYLSEAFKIPHLKARRFDELLEDLKAPILHQAHKRLVEAERKEEEAEDEVGCTRKPAWLAVGMTMVRFHLC